MAKKIKVGLLVGEFFSNELPYLNCMGGYGMLARNYIAEYLPNEEFELETIIGVAPEADILEVTLDEHKKVVYLPKDIVKPLDKQEMTKCEYKFKKFVRSLTYPYRYYKRNKLWQEKLNEYDIFLSIEFQNIAHRVMKNTKKTPLLFFIQDPRPQSEWDEIDSVELIKKNEGGRPNKKVAKFINQLYKDNRFYAISQGRELIAKARELYQLPKEFDSEFVPNPVIPAAEVPAEKIKEKGKKVLYLGRQDAVKRPWMFAELAKMMPDFDFYITGQTHEKEMDEIMEPYRSLENLHFTGHVDGEEKHKLLSDCRYLVNPSIHEAVPVSFLEAMIYGTVVVSSRYSDGLPEKFGKYVGQINGNGIESVHLFKEAILALEENEEERFKLAEEGMNYAKDIHSVENFQINLRKSLKEVLDK